MSVELGLGLGFDVFLREIEDSGIYGNFGPQVTLLEREYEEYLGADEGTVVSCANATLALAGTLGRFPHRGWAMPSWTFAATAHAALLSGASASFVDINPRTQMMLPEHEFTDSGALVTAPFGSQIAIDGSWNAFRTVVIDAAAAIAQPPLISGDFRGKWAKVFSLHATKVLGVGEGAIVQFSHRSDAESFRKWTNFGFDGDRHSRFPAINAKMSEIHAAIGRFRLGNWQAEKQQWLSARLLTNRFATELGIGVSFENASTVSPYWIVEFGSAGQKSRARSALLDTGIETRDWWGEGCHAMAAFQTVSRMGSLPATEGVASRTLGLPFFRNIQAETIERIADVIGSAIE